jgi:hypothetical protein
MVNPAWREELRRELARRGLPPSYIERLVQELCDHFDDMEEEVGMEAGSSCSPDERMGQPTNLAAAAVAEYHKRAFSRKHPVVTFAVLPVLLLFGLWGTLVVAAYVVGAVAELDDSVSITLIDLLIANCCILIPIAVVALAFCRFARNNGLDRRWPMMTTGILAVIAASIWSNVITAGPKNEPTLGLMLGLPLVAQPILQAMLIFAIGGWYCWQGRRPQTVP